LKYVATTHPSIPTLAFQKAITDVVVQSYVTIPLNELQPLKLYIAHSPVEHTHILSKPTK